VPTILILLLKAIKIVLLLIGFDQFEVVFLEGKKEALFLCRKGAHVSEDIIDMGAALLGRPWAAVFGIWYRDPFSEVFLT